MPSRHSGPLAALLVQFAQVAQRRGGRDDGRHFRGRELPDEPGERLRPRPAAYPQVLGARLGQCD